MRGAKLQAASELHYSLASAAVESFDDDGGDVDEDVDDIDTKRKLGWAVVTASATRPKRCECTIIILAVYIVTTCVK